MRQWLIAIGVVLVSGSASLAEDMTGAELTSLLAGGKTFALGGPKEGYKGQLALNSDGTGKGAAKTDKGDNIALTGKWRIKGNAFCRKWTGMDKKEVCETWQKDGANRVVVMVKGKKIGVNSW